MKPYRTKDNPLKQVYITFPFMGIVAPPGYVLTPDQCVETGYYRDISPPCEEGFQLGEVATFDEEDGTVTMSVVVIPEQPPYVPEEITRRQGDLMLYDANLYDAVQAVIATLTPRQQLEARSATTYSRTNEVLVYVLTSAGKTPAQIDQMFIEASQL